MTILTPLQDRFAREVRNLSKRELQDMSPDDALWCACNVLVDPSDARVFLALYVVVGHNNADLLLRYERWRREQPIPAYG